MLHRPALPLLDGIPCHEIAGQQTFDDAFHHGLRHLGQRFSLLTRIPVRPRFVHEVMIRGIAGHVAHGGDVNQAGSAIERHGMPVVGAKRRGPRVLRILAMIGDVGFHRATGFQIHVACPVQLAVGFGGQQLSGNPIEHIKEAVFRRLHNH